MSARFLFDNFRWGLSGENQALLVEDGRVLYRGPRFDSQAMVPTVDLRGRYVLPALIESHCHILSTGLDLARLNLGGLQSAEETLDRVRQGHSENSESWLLAVHYDQNRWGGPHLTREQLDSVSRERPILLRHVNGHAGVANSAALIAAGIRENEPDPSGGSFGRSADGTLNGLLLENALQRVYEAVPKPNLESMVEAILAAGKSMHAYGIACAHDMMTGGTDLDLELEAYQLAAERGNPIDVRLYVQWSDALGRGARHAERLKVMRTRPEGSRSPIVAGVKIFADGAIGSATAAIYGGYGEEGSSSRQVSSQVSGQLMYPPERLTTMVREAHHEGWSVATHAIGDYAADLVMNAYEATPEPSRHRIEHAMMLSDGQIERLARLGVAVSMQPEFLVRFGHTYRLQLGERRASLLNRAQSLTAAGVSVSFSSDRPIVSGDPWLGIQSSVRRPEGFDPSENVTPQTALAGYLDRAASISHDRTDTAALALGCLAKGLVVEEDPLEARGRPQTITWLSEFIQGETDQSQR